MAPEPNNQNVEGSGTAENRPLTAKLDDCFGPDEKTVPGTPSLSPSKVVI